ncbi:hypothetical protein [Vulcaniibacterium tengchongense]|uniref:Uncharacterized protein n=1 Tax=Vulcaniibacterium tengchongense TaxID=1273429 RepID=A0A3N4V3J4_9GAMM|nr:hypothetical protein [Vulcaniibacterium tengchongense]RPE77058.1 hypothetical protein EDC50_2313 [Vulcaniibacterium tengchongense]
MSWLWLVAGVLVVAALVFAGWVKAASGQEVEAVKGAHGRTLLRDTPALRELAALSYDNTIEMEKSGHVMSGGMSWNDRWLGTIRSIRKENENPEWYVRYIVEQRRKAGLPELEGVDDARP